jgi:flagellar protein FlaD
MENGNVRNNVGNSENTESRRDDNRNIIKLEELKEQGEVKAPDSEEYLEESDLKTLIYAERGSIPSVVLDEIYDNLRGRRVSRKQLKRIISKVKENLDTEAKIERIDDLYKKLDALEKLLKNFGSRKLGEIESGEGESEESEVIEEAERLEIENGTEVTSEVPGIGFELESRSPKSAEVRGDNGGMEMEKVGMVEGGMQKGDGSESERENGIKLTALPPDSKRIIFLLKWIEYLVERVGYEELENALDYYVDIGWISEEVLFSILRYAKGIKLYHEKSDWRPVGYLNVQDHIMSLMFIEALRTGKFSREKIMEVEREVFRMKREAMELNGI